MPDIPALSRKAETYLQSTLPDARLEKTHIELIPEIELLLINADYQTGPLDPEIMHAVIARPAYWAFCWGSGVALARWILDHPETIKGRPVADVGCGCGVVAIAAAMAGADVIACDIDPHALAATEANAALAGVNLTLASDVAELPRALDHIYLADVLYDRTNFGLLKVCKPHTREIIVADSRVADVEDPSFEKFHAMHALTQPNLGEFEEFKTVSFFRWQV